MDVDPYADCPDWCEGSHEPGVLPHASDWDGAATEDGVSLLSRVEAGADGVEYVTVAMQDAAGAELAVRLTLDEAGDAWRGLRNAAGDTD